MLWQGLCPEVMEEAGSSQQGLGPTPEARLASQCIARRLDRAGAAGADGWPGTEMADVRGYNIYIDISTCIYLHIIIYIYDIYICV